MKSSHRKPPYKAHLDLYLPRVRGKCQWCGVATDEKTETGLGRYWHADCKKEFEIIVFPQVARKYVARRDKEVCSDCGESKAWDSKHKGEWQVDHHIPLWKVAYIEPIQRLEYFKLHNLVTRCTDCHERKSASEAAERAHGRNIRGENKPKPKRSWPCVKLPSSKNSKWVRKIGGRTVLRDEK